MTQEWHSDALFSFSLFQSLPLNELQIRNEQQGRKRRKPSRKWNTRWGSLATMLNINSFLERKKNLSILFLSYSAKADLDFGWRCWNISFYSTNSPSFKKCFHHMVDRAIKSQKISSGYIVNCCFQKRWHPLIGIQSHREKAVKVGLHLQV